MTIDSNFIAGQVLTADELNADFARAASEADGFFLANATGGSASATLSAANINGIYIVSGTSGPVTITLALANIKVAGHATQVIRNSSSYVVNVAVQSGDNLDSQVTAIQPGQSAAYVSNGDTTWYELWNEAGTPSLVTNLAYAATNSSSTAGTTAGTVNMYMPQQGDGKTVILTFNGYENDTTTNQTINFPVAFSVAPLVVGNNTGLTLTASTTGITITAPDVTTTYSGTAAIMGD